MPPEQGVGPLEMRVLGMLRKDSPLDVGAIRARLEAECSELAYTTVMTVLARLFEKGLVTREREGKRYVYSPARRAPHVLEGMLQRVRHALFAEERKGPILALLEEEDFSAEELRELRRTIDRKLKEAKSK